MSMRLASGRVSSCLSVSRLRKDEKDGGTRLNLFVVQAWRSTCLHVSHMRHDIPQVLFARKTRELAGNGVLPTAREHLGGFPGSGTGLGFILDEEVFVRLSVGHDVGWGWRTGL